MEKFPPVSPFDLSGSGSWLMTFHPLTSLPTKLHTANKVSDEFISHNDFCTRCKNTKTNLIIEYNSLYLQNKIASKNETK